MPRVYLSAMGDSVLRGGSGQIGSCPGKSGRK
jgi:hypothetical protein